MLDEDRPQTALADGHSGGDMGPVRVRRMHTARFHAGGSRCSGQLGVTRRRHCWEFMGRRFRSTVLPQTTLYLYMYIITVKYSIYYSNTGCLCGRSCMWAAAVGAAQEIVTESVVEALSGTRNGSSADRRSRNAASSGTRFGELTRVWLRRLERVELMQRIQRIVRWIGRLLALWRRRWRPIRRAVRELSHVEVQHLRVGRRRRAPERGARVVAAESHRRTTFFKNNNIVHCTQKPIQIITYHFSPIITYKLHTQSRLRMSLPRDSGQRQHWAVRTRMSRRPWEARGTRRPAGGQVFHRQKSLHPPVRYILRPLRPQ